LIYKKIDLTDLPFYNVSEDAAKSFIDWRCSIKKPMTQRAFNLALKEAVLCGQLGLTPDEVLDKTQLWGWQAPNYAYTADKLKKEFDSTVKTYAQNYSNNRIVNETTRMRTIEQDLSDKTWAN